MSAITPINKIFNNNLSVYVVGLLLATLMLDYGFGSFSLVLLVFYSLFKFFTKNNNEVFFDYKLTFPVLLFLWFSVTYFWTIDKSLTLKGIGRISALFLVPFAFCFLPKFTRLEFFKILKAYTVVNFFLGIVFVITSLIRFLESRKLTEFTYHDLVSSFNLNAIYVSVFFSLSFFYLFLKPKKRIYEIVFLIFFLMMIVLLSSKTIIFCLLIGIIFIGWKKVKNRTPKLVEIVLTFLVICLIALLATKEITKRVNEEFVINSDEKTNLLQVLEKDKFSQVYPWTGTSIRLFQLRLLKEQIETEHVFLNGFGLFASRIDLKKRHEQYGTYKGYHIYNYHNCYAQVLSETGIIGLLLFLFLLSSNIVFALKSNNLLFVFFSFVAPVWSFTESFLWVQRGIFFFIIFYCLFNRTEFYENKE
ncbi:O-antigen ligase family protein [Tamlana flava]|uniref:O-antigen ligase family protein n=1 Tax=Tamlana flava TaxID=3158572 RepID=UPI00351ACB93